jgi:DNA-binding MarR family transcriptional regulator
VAQRLGIDRTTIVAMLDAFEAKGLVSRHPHPADRRCNVVELSESGRAAVEAGIRDSDEAESPRCGRRWPTRPWRARTPSGRAPTRA